MNLNKVILAGRISKAPELRSTKGGQAVATFSLATNRVWMDKSNQKKEDVEYHQVVVWGNLANSVSKWLTIGQGVLVEGRLQTRSYEGKDGQKRYTTEIVAENVQFGQKPIGKTGTVGTDAPAIEEIPTIDIDGGITAEQLPF